VSIVLSFIIGSFFAVQVDTIPRIRAQVSQDTSTAPVDTIYFWENSAAYGSFTADTDSTLRWTHVLNYADVIHRQKGAITARLGTSGRNDGVNIYSFENRHLSLEMEGMDLTDPLTGSVNWNRLPTHKIRMLDMTDWSTEHHSRVRLRDHYLTKPRTYLNFDESKFDFSNLEFGYTQNLTRRFNLELSFWDRNDENGFSASRIDGQQIVARTYYQISDHWQVKGGFINNSIDQDQSFGFVIPDLELFTFNRFNATPVEFSARSNQRSGDIYVQLHNRKDKKGKTTTQFGLHHQTWERNLSYSADTVATDFRKIELFARHHINLLGFKTEATARLYNMADQAKQSLTETSWNGGVLNANFRRNLAKAGALLADAGIDFRDDSKSGYNLSGRLEFYPSKGFNFSFFAGISSDIPDIQSLYWQSVEFSGNSGLKNEEAVQAGVEASLSLSNHFTLGSKVMARRVSDGIFVNPDSVFTNIDTYNNLSGSVWLKLDSKRFEGEMSITGQTFTQASGGSENSVNFLLDNSGERVWMKGGLWWKNDVFDNAAFVKAGLFSIYSPQRFLASSYIPALNRFQNGVQRQGIPSFYRVDLDISARIRWFMLLLKFENLFDEVGQLGYFETAGYPMPPRRLMFSIRVIFTD